MQKANIKKLFTPIIILIICIGISIFAWQRAKSFIEYQKQEQFNDATREVVIRTEDKLNEYMDVLFGARALFAASKSVERDEWNAYVNSLPINERFSGMQALSFVKRVSLEDKESFIEEVQNDTSLISEGYPNFSISPEGDREEYYVVSYIEPLEGNEAAFGFDISSNSSRRLGLEKARDINDLVATAPISLVQETEEQVGFLVFLPIYKNGMSIEAIEERRGALIGYISAVFRAEDLLSALLQDVSAAKGLNVDIFDSTDNLGEKSKLVSHKYGESSFLPMFVHDSDLNVAGRKWTLHFENSSEFFASSVQEILPLAVLVAGLIFSILIFIILYTSTSTKVKALKLAQSMTKQADKARKSAEAKAIELEKLNNLMMGRESRIIELKQENQKLRKKGSEKKPQSNKSNFYDSNI